VGTDPTLLIIVVHLALCPRAAGGLESQRRTFSPPSQSRTTCKSPRSPEVPDPEHPAPTWETYSVPPSAQAVAADCAVCTLDSSTRILEAATCPCAKTAAQLTRKLTSRQATPAPANRQTVDKRVSVTVSPGHFSFLPRATPRRLPVIHLSVHRLYSTTTPSVPLLLLVGLAITSHL